MILHFPLYFLALVGSVRADVTIYTTLTTPTSPGGTTSTIDPVVPTGLLAWNNIVLTPPPLPDPSPPNNFLIQLYPGGMAGLSIPQMGSFNGLSIELSLSNEIIARNSSLIQVPFLNALGNLRTRAGQGAVIRVGGNSQERAKLYPDNGFGNFRAINKTRSATTPTVDYDSDIFYIMSNITALLDTTWFFGLPFDNATNTTGISQIVATVEEILGSSLLALQLGNEPDLSEPFPFGDHRTPPYTPQDFVAEWKAVIAAMQAQPAIPRQDILLGPSPCCGVGGFGVSDLINAGFLTELAPQLAYFSVQHYYMNNCVPPYFANGQTQQAGMYTHEAAVQFIAPYIPGCAEAQAAGKPCIMFETNTASCSGFAGLSDAFGAALFGIDAILQSAYGNFTNLLWHCGGSGSSYNAFTPPPANISKTHQWTFGPIFYSTLVSTEIFGSSNRSRVVDLFANNNNPYTPAYAIYEGGNPTRVALINFQDDMGTGTNAYTANIAIGGGNTGSPSTTPSTVSVRYLSAPSVTEKFNITWAGQTMGGQLAADGILRGDVVTETVNCNTQAGTCPIRVPAPGFALVFLTPEALTASSAPPQDPTLTFPTTTARKSRNTATVNQAVLATSNGRGGPGLVSSLEFARLDF